MLPDFFLSLHPGGRVDHSRGPGIRQVVKRRQGEALLFIVLGSLSYLVVVVASQYPGGHPSSSAGSSRAHVYRCSPLSRVLCGEACWGKVTESQSLDLGFKAVKRVPACCPRPPVLIHIPGDLISGVWAMILDHNAKKLLWFPISLCSCCMLLLTIGGLVHDAIR